MGFKLIISIFIISIIKIDPHKKPKNKVVEVFEKWTKINDHF